ncbi:MerR family transcriptional regulator [Nocardia brasiliensis]|uniref:MerR family transcriptional regulator n=1 Tax=Nocardia brasiliensis TaxID=37326 RepID=UPI0024558AA4|nr:MerR family transcriptional regulator [Nocardia brasiliensis]
MTEGAEYTIDELAREAGTTVRALRVYHERGVLPPPQVKGRTGYYGIDHLNRVHTISRLLVRGIKLNGIRELLDAWDRGEDLGVILGVAEGDESGSSDSTAAGPSAHSTIAATELGELYREVPNGLARVVAAGLYEPVDAATYRVVDRQLVRSAEQLVAAGIPRADALTELERLRADCDRIARRFADLFDRNAGQEFRSSDRTPADIAELAARLAVAKGVPGRTAADFTNQSIRRLLELDTELAEALAQS